MKESTEELVKESTEELVKESTESEEDESENEERLLEYTKKETERKQRGLSNYAQPMTNYVVKAVRRF